MGIVREGYFEAVSDRMRECHGWQVEEEWLGDICLRNHVVIVSDDGASGFQYLHSQSGADEIAEI